MIQSKTEISLPEGVSEANKLIQSLDTCLMTGFSNLGAEQHNSLSSLQAIFTASPLGQVLGEAIAALSSGSYLPHHFQVIASARLALQGAQYQQLRQAMRQNLGRHAEVSASDAIEFSEATALQKSAAHWLMDIAIAGFSRLELPTVTAFSTSLAQIQADANLMPLASLLTGFMQELIGAVPIPAGQQAPLYRWVDLWSRALVLSLQQAKEATTIPMSGVFYPLGIDWRQHSFMTSLVYYGILESDTGLHFLRCNQSAYKVDVISYEEQWLLFPQMAMLAESLESGKAINLDEMPVLASGDLIWHIDRASMGKKYSLIEIAEACFAPEASEVIRMPQLAAHQYHPVHLAEPVYLKNIALKGSRINSEDYSFELDKRRILDTELGLNTLNLCDSAFGLLRYDNEKWLFQPLAAAKEKGKPIYLGKDSVKILKTIPKTSTLAILQERASRLLRGQGKNEA
jgi:hypothetical protein